MKPLTISIRQASELDERGFTLQTLIVTAVVVLLAVAAGVVIIAITRSSTDDLVGTQSKLDGPCKPWEIHDTELEAAGAGGGEPSFHKASETDTYQPSGSPGAGGYTSSAVGCLAPCYLILNDQYDVIIDLAIQENAAYFLQKHAQDNSWYDITGGDGINPNVSHFTSFQQGNLKYDTSNRLPKYPLWQGGITDEMPGRYEVRVGVVSEISPNQVSQFKVDTNVGSKVDLSFDRFIKNISATGAMWNGDLNLMLARPEERDNTPLGTPLGLADPPFSKGSNMAIRAVAEARACDVYDTATNEVLASSDESRVGAIIA